MVESASSPRTRQSRLLWKAPRCTFEYDDESFVLAAPDDATVLDTKQRIAARFAVFAARDLSDTWLLSRQSTSHRSVFGLIRSINALLLQSVGYGSRPGEPRPPDFVARVDQLEAAIGKDWRTCSHCPTLCDYDTERAFAALQSHLDD
jgi:hypothetical protein